MAIKPNNKKYKADISETIPSNTKIALKRVECFN